MPPELNPLAIQTTAELSRRTLLRAGLVAAGAMLIGACGKEEAPPPAIALDPPTPKPESPIGVTVDQHPGLKTSTDPQLRLLGQYEENLERGLPEIMHFITMPPSMAEASGMAAGVARQIKSCAETGVAPRFILEPVDVDLQHFDPKALDAYFATLRAQGVTDKQMGTWVPLPEPSLPELWEGGTSPQLFVKNFNTIATVIKRHFPDAQVCMMLDSSTFPSGDWDSRTYKASPLLAYTKGIKTGLVDEFGLQGFPRVSGSTDPHTLIQNGVALQAANSLGAKKIWINTGTYRQERDANPDTGHKLVKATPEQRKAFLAGIVQEVAALRAAGKEVTLTLFSENKFISGNEGVDWSYNPDEIASMVKPFANELTRLGAGFSIFDQRA